MPECIIGGIPVNFPFEPYEVQKAYMEKVITCLRDGTNGVLESPTGTGKTLSLLCSTLAWILSRKAEMKAQVQKTAATSAQPASVMEEVLAQINGAQKTNNWGVPKIIYATRTHSQLSQAMQELKRSSYSFMRAVVLGSRDQLCIHPDIMREQGNTNKIQMCQLRIQTKTCSFYGRVESKKEHPDLKGPTVMDIEDLVTVGKKHKMCPYFAAKELVPEADITFMPYNYLLDPKLRKANKVELNNTIIILDEAHNIEKICEESASVQIKSSDIAMAIEDVTHVMKSFSTTDEEFQADYGEEPKDFTLDQLALLKEMLLDLEMAVDDIEVENRNEGATFPAQFIFELLAKANFTYSSANNALTLLEKLLQFMTIQGQNIFFRKGGSFKVLQDLLSVVFFPKEEGLSKVYRSYKVHVEIEETKQQEGKRTGGHKDTWLSKSSSTTAQAAKVINYWCFNPGFGMEQLINKNVRSIILTSGTLAPLKPLIAELAIPVGQYLENPHIVSHSQVYVKIISQGPDKEQLISNYANRDNPKYIASLGQTILNVSRITPDGLLVFFPSYTLLNQCQNSWQASGLWSNISTYKPIFVEPRNKESFTTTMEEFYQSIRDNKGACFLAVCRGKVSEGLDFADRNGRAVIITGLPFPPLKDPKVILKKKYLEANRTKENELLSGQAWYGLEATRAVNQAIGRVIRHRHDYGAILLCDARFQQPSQVAQLSKWIRGHLGQKPHSSNFGPIVRELREFFRTAEKTMPKPEERSVESLVQETCEEAGIVRSSYFSNPKEVLEAKSKFENAQKMAIKVEKTNTIESWTPEDYAAAAGRSRSQVPTAMDFMSRLNSDVSTIDFNNSEGSLVKIHKRERASPTPDAQEEASTNSTSPTSSSCEASKRKRYKLVDSTSSVLSPQSGTGTTSLRPLSCFNFTGKPALSSTSTTTTQKAPEESVEFLRVLRSVLSPQNFSAFTAALISYKNDNTFEALMKLLLDILGKPQLRYMLLGMRRFLKAEHKAAFDQEIANSAT